MALVLIFLSPQHTHLNSCQVFICFDLKDEEDDVYHKAHFDNTQCIKKTY